MPSFDKNKLREVFRAGEYWQWNDAKQKQEKVVVTAEDINEIAESYDTGFHQAPFFIGHPEISGAPALAWVGACVAENGVLYISCSEVSQEAMELTEKGFYKKVSVEIYRFEKDGKTVKYLGAIGLTNMPLVKSLPIWKWSFSEEHKRNTGYKEKYSLTADNNFNFTNSNNNIKMHLTEVVKKFAERLGISVSDSSTDSAVLEYASQCIDKLKKKFSDDPESVNSLSLFVAKCSEQLDKLSSLQEDVKKFADEKAELLIGAALDSKKIVEAQKENFLKFAKNNYDDTKSILASMQPLAMFAQNAVQESEDILKAETPSSNGEDSSKWSFEDWSKKDPKGLTDLKMSNLSKFKDLYKKEYGIEYIV